jgi:hypothetical protein
LGDSLNISETETTFEINLAVMNLNYTIKIKKMSMKGRQNFNAIPKTNVPGQAQHI